METVEVPQINAGEVLLRTIYLSIDPYMRGRMNDTKSYAEPVKIDEIMTGQVVAKVERSNLDGFTKGDYVLSGSGWQDYAVSDGSELMNLGQDPQNASWSLGILGMPGYTAYAGLLKIGNPKPGDTVVVAAASGPVGATVGQIAKIKGCRVVGIAGGSKKCRHVLNNLGFDACLDHKAGDFSDQLRAACPGGIDIYFENVGGDVTRAIAPLLNKGARVPICGFISKYNEGDMLTVETPFHVLGALKDKPEHRFFVVTEWMDEWEDATKEILDLVSKDKMRYRETVTKGFENAPQALRDVLTGKNFGKQIIEI